MEIGSGVEAEWHLKESNISSPISFESTLLLLCGPKANAKATRPILIKFSKYLYFKPKQVHKKLFLTVLSNEARFGQKSKLFRKFQCLFLKITSLRLLWRGDNLTSSVKPFSLYLLIKFILSNTLMTHIPNKQTVIPYLIL